MHTDAIDALLELLEFADEIERMRYLAIERLLELVGESLNRALRLAPSLEGTFADTRQVIGMRNRLAHEYDAIDAETIWDTAFNDIPAMIRNIRLILESNGAL